MDRTCDPRGNALPRRAALQSIAGLGFLGLSGGAFAAAGDQAAGGPALASAVPAGTSLTIADVGTQVGLATSGEDAKLPFKVDWANLLAGPAILQAFRARAIDVGTVGGIPPLLALSTGLDIKIVALQYRPIPAYVLATAPGSHIQTTDDLKGKKIGFSAGQEQGLFVLELLAKIGLKKEQVSLIRLTSLEFQNALASRQVDAAPISEPQLTTYLGLFGRDGAIALRPDVQATPTTLTASSQSLADPAKAAAIAAYVRAWYAAQIWEYENTAAWIAAYYVQNQHVTADDGKRIIDSLGKPQFPRNWDIARRIERDANTFLASEQILDIVKVNDLFDTRFETIAASLVPQQYLVA